MKKDFIVRRSITIVEGKPHVETYSEEPLVRCKDCKYYTEKAFENNGVNYGECHKLAIGLGVFTVEDWFCADGEVR